MDHSSRPLPGNPNLKFVARFALMHGFTVYFARRTGEIVFVAPNQTGRVRQNGRRKDTVPAVLAMVRAHAGGAR